MPIAANSLSPTAVRVGKRLMRLVRNNPTIVGGDIGVPEVNFDHTSAGDAPQMRQIRIQQATSRAVRLNHGAFDNTRQRINHDYRAMEREVPELRNSKAVLVDFAFGGDSDATDREDAGVEVIYAPSARPLVKQVNAETQRMLKFNVFLPGVLDEGIQLGNSFSELVYKAGRPHKLVGQKPLVPSEDAHVHWDEYCNLVGYTFRNRQAGTPVQVLLPWQVAHLAIDRKRGYLYGDSNWLAARKIWRQEQAGMDVLGILTILRAAARKSVAYAVPDNIPEDDVWDFIQKMAQGGWSEDLLDADGMMIRQIVSLLELEDIIYPYRASANPPTFHDEKPADLEQLKSTLEYYQERYFVATGVPAGLAGMERNVNARSTLEHQGLFFVRKVRSLQRQLARFTVEVLVKGLLARGIVPQLGEFTVKMPRVSTFDAKVDATTDRIKAQTIKLLHTEGGLDLAWVLEFALNIDEEDAQRMAARAGAQGTQRPDAEEIAEALKSTAEGRKMWAQARAYAGEIVPDVKATVTGDMLPEVPA